MIQECSSQVGGPFHTAILYRTIERRCRVLLGRVMPEDPRTETERASTLFSQGQTEKKKEANQEEWVRFLRVYLHGSALPYFSKPTSRLAVTSSSNWAIIFCFRLRPW